MYYNAISSMYGRNDILRESVMSLYTTTLCEDILVCSRNKWTVNEKKCEKYESQPGKKQEHSSYTHVTHFSLTNYIL